MLSDEEVDVQSRAERATLDIKQTHLPDHDPALVAQRRTRVQAAWPAWRPQNAAHNGGSLRE